MEASSKLGPLGLTLIVLAWSMAVPVASADHGVIVYHFEGTIPAEVGWTGLIDYPTFPVPADASKVVVHLAWSADVPTVLDAGVETDWTPCYDGGLYWFALHAPRCIVDWQIGSSDPSMGWYVSDSANLPDPALSGTATVEVPGSHIAALSDCTDVCDWTTVARARLPAALAEYTFTVEVHH